MCLGKPIESIELPTDWADTMAFHQWSQSWRVWASLKKSPTTKLLDVLAFHKTTLVGSEFLPLHV